tara:strand:+ start:547 stop:753 length:207 start_codon:yes stop_codon:yes gene_type:complete
MRVMTEYHLSEKDELYQTWKYYEEKLQDALIVPSHLYDVVTIYQLREQIKYYKEEYYGYDNGSRTLCG